ncbi:WD repeat protein, putative [Trichomonas vaginalis G3]|uniref:WD repeat protein, putative n=1 Tax=Trichomonas vaginalis (strain ATCC PRA-98 / G3) TaxID=412133 RepID=A2E5G2_TRIV3|nr:WD-repeat protein BING4 family [Trichomonas vaginalis G3]EAY12123.1 WD repeat protein, putative [Trichomonas vaginalis G3]KAI5542389.1 WD-repeat protein BING4 family [Trichomonas vaginalis G3]|eukprot:XP_001324346.1 WD repeat protein [Trichomonas vaginalis G3]
MSKDQPTLPDRDEWFSPEQKEKYEKYVRGADDEELIDEEVKAPAIRNELIHHKEDVSAAARSAARSEMLHTVEKGYIDSQTRLSQREILKEIPIAIAARKFDFQLPNGPYHVDITENGRTLLLGGEGGHLAMFDWFNGQKHLEINPEFKVRDVCFLGDNTRCAMATNKSLYILDKTGVQMHEIREANGATHLEFLPHFWLLVAATEHKHLVYTDITSGEIVMNAYTTFLPTCMCRNRQSGVIALGHDRGSISLWTPNTNEPVARLQKHTPAVVAIDIDMTGTKLAAAHGDGNIQIWDLRNFNRCYQKRSDFAGITDIAFSATGVLGVARGNHVEMYNKYEDKRAFLSSKYPSKVTSLKFATFEDFAIIGLQSGISSMVVPGSGEPNLDSNVANPFETAEWRQEQEVRHLLDKLPKEMISLDPSTVFHVGKIENKHKERTERLKKKRMIKVDANDQQQQNEEEPNKKQKNQPKKVTMERKLRMMKDEYNRKLIEEKTAQLKKEADGKDEEADPLARFQREKKSKNF